MHRTQRPAIVVVIGLLCALLVASCSDEDGGNKSQNAKRDSPGVVATSPGKRCAYRELEPSEVVKEVDRPTGDAFTPSDMVATLRTNAGTITIHLDGTAAPCTARSWKHLGEAGFYNGSSCHRLGPGFLQCGDPSSTSTGGPSYEYLAENVPDSEASLPRGSVVMAGTTHGRIGSQFFFVTERMELSGEFGLAGFVTAGMEIIDAVAAAGHDNSYDVTVGGGHPLQALTFESLTVVEKG